MKKFKTIEIQSINEILPSQTEPVVYKLKIDEQLSLSGLYKINNNADKIIIFFNGAVNGELTDEPVFMRWSWAQENNLSYICFDDPVVSCTKLTNLGWYVGTSDHDLQEYINLIVSYLIESLQINPVNVIFYGASGGGFAALMAAIRLRGSVAIVNNPQTNIFKYYKSATQRFISHFFEKHDVSSDSEQYYRFSTLDAIKKFNYIPAILYIQNIQDKFHLERHLIPFQTSILQTLSSIDDYPNKIHFNFFNDSRGHGIFSDKSEFLNEITQASRLTERVTNYPSLFATDRANYLTEKAIWRKLPASVKDNLEVSFELNFEPLIENSRPAIFLIDTEEKDYHELKKYGYSFSPSLNCAFKYLDGILPDKQITMTIPKELKALNISLRKWKCVGDLHVRNFEVKTKND